ncbi:MAG: nucleotide exchange factor GrpE [Dehalococcoidales bacterium]|nr:MAG: nucleotide exchange factor GrpE [Dehalococcoidales bacterium]
MIPQEPEESGNEAEVNADEGDSESLQQSLTAEKEKAEIYLANWQRAQADFINFKRRTEQEKEEIRRSAQSAVVLNLLSVLDDFERALALIPPDSENIDWIEGIRLIERKLRTSLEAQGLCPIQAVGEPFDPHQHEAIRQANGEDGIVLEEVEKGYKLNDRILRATKVVVGNGKETEPEGSKFENKG